MATGFLDFESDTVGAAPSGLTAMLNTSDATWTVQDDGAGGQCLRLVKSGTNDAAMSIDAIGNTSGDVELYALLRTGSTNGSQCGVGCLLETNTSTATKAQSYLWANLWQDNQIETAIREATAQSTWGGGYASYNWSANTLYHMRVRLTGTDAKLRMWADGETEPATWLSEKTGAAGTLTSGFAGPTARDVNGTKEWLFIGWATAGDTAPTEGSAEDQLSTPTNFTFTAAASTRQLDGSFDAVSGASTYDWEVDENTDGTWIAFASGNTASTSFQLTDTDGVDWSTAYRARVRAVPA